MLLETDGDSALRRIRTERPKVAVIDINLGNESGLDVLREVKKHYPRLAVIIMTGISSTQSAIEAMKYGAYDYMTKPFNFNKLKDTIHKILACSALNRKVHYTADPGQLQESDIDADVMIGSSPEMFEIWKMVGKIADSDASVLIQEKAVQERNCWQKQFIAIPDVKTGRFWPSTAQQYPIILLKASYSATRKGHLRTLIPEGSASLSIVTAEQCSLMK